MQHGLVDGQPSGVGIAARGRSCSSAPASARAAVYVTVTSAVVAPPEASEEALAVSRLLRPFGPTSTLHKADNERLCSAEGRSASLRGAGAVGRAYRQQIETPKCQCNCQCRCQCVLSRDSPRLIALEGGEPLCRSAPDSDLDKPEGESKRRFVSGYEAGLRHCRDRRPKSKRESDQKTVEGSHQHSSPCQS